MFEFDYFFEDANSEFLNSTNIYTEESSTHPTVDPTAHALPSLNPTSFSTSYMKIPNSSNVALSNERFEEDSCSAFKDDLTCRQSHCAWIGTECSSSCLLLQDFKLYGDVYKQVVDVNETMDICEKRCWQDIECHGLWFWGLSDKPICCLFREFDYERCERKTLVPSKICHLEKEVRKIFISFGSYKYPETSNIIFFLVWWIKFSNG